MMGSTGVTESNMMSYLGIIEHRTNQLLHRLQVRDAHTCVTRCIYTRDMTTFMCDVVDMHALSNSTTNFYTASRVYDMANVIPPSPQHTATRCNTYMTCLSSTGAQWQQYGWYGW